jgi:serine/threonine-protein kinase
VSESEPRGAHLVGAVLENAYRITRLVGEGGMGAVYEAVQLRLNKRVAVKVMARDLSANREALARFHREAEITSHLGHPHLVTVIDFGTAASGEPYLVMEYLDGTDLDHRIRKQGRLPLETAVHITKQVASALSAAHDRGIVHRDLKPANVFLLQATGESDFVKILDFGISKMKAARTQLTNASAVMGTPNYMAPEQATGAVDDIDPRTDEWSLACIVWEMLSGRGPFAADDVSALLYQVIHLDPQPLAKRAPNLPPGVEPVLRRALSKRMADRYPSIADFTKAFEAAALGRAVAATPAPVAVPRASRGKETVAYGSAGAASADPDVLKQVTTFSRTSGEMTDAGAEVPARRLKPIHAIAAAAGAIVVVATIFLLRSGQPPVQKATSPVRPSIVALPSEPAPAPAPPPPVVVAPKPAETEPKPVELKSKAKKAKPAGYVDPFAPSEGAEPVVKHKPGKTDVLEPTDPFQHGNDSRPATPARPKPKLPIMKDL